MQCIRNNEKFACISNRTNGSIFRRATFAQILSPSTKTNIGGKMSFFCATKFIVSVYIVQCILCMKPLFTESELLINVQNQGGEVIQETITSNLDDDSIILEFQRTDGTLITQLLDFRNDIQVLKALVLGEEERGQSQYQVMCFVSRLSKNDFISTDAMSKLRQKNPSTIRQPEEDRGRENFTMTAWVNLRQAAPLSQHISTLCTEAADSTYISDFDIRILASKPGASVSKLELAIYPFPTTQTTLSTCNAVSGLWTPCTCLLEMCIGWYPCGLKFCKGKIDTGIGNNASYRCGIKTCRKCYQYLYYVQQKQQCLWYD
ncbi:out at first protein [Sitodiplosis mosellana]|uniref:out at first protein n=1 Tax=Sitodiplosis mosellana TaxID=263140 RepID=UPI002443A0E6|nr:out at first protein [Sitodiplosis mosellana]